jgi:signal peptidase II
MSTAASPSPSAKWTLVGLTVGFTVLDQVSKWMANTYLHPNQPWPIIPQVFQLTLAYNTGAAFSMFHNQPALLTGFTSLVFLALLAYGLSRQQFLKGELLAMALILGGALGNLLDRMLLGHVTDFFDVVAIHYPVFNVADSFIFCGVLLLMGIQIKSQAQEPMDTPPMPSHDVPRDI